MNAPVRICLGIPILLLLCGAVGTGCGGGGKAPTSNVRIAPNEAPEAPLNEAPANGFGGEEGKAPVGGAPAPAAPARKVIQTSTATLVVKKLDEAKRQLNQLIDENGAYISKSEFVGNRGTRRAANWTIRVPVEKFAKFVDAVLALGIPEHLTSDAQDVTEEYVDVEARLKNLKAEEETLNRLMKELAKSNADLIAFREQIRELREKSEKAEARLQKLTGLTSMSTLHLTMQEEKNYVPPSAPAKPTFSGRINETFDSSIGLLSQFGEMLLLGAVAVAPWVPLLVLAMGCMWLFFRRSLKRSQTVPEPSSPTPPEPPSMPDSQG